jgi:hypothetical protein
MKGKHRCFDHMANFIKEKRISHSKKYSQAELSHLLGYKNGQFISNVERGLCGIPLKALADLIQVLGLDKTDLMKVLLEDYRLTLENHLFDEESGSPAKVLNPSDSGIGVSLNFPS